ncbi:MAG: PEP-utilizing enzyme [Kofleriaceae bacterium]
MWIELADAAGAAGVGGKARGLARLVAAGLRVPDGVVLPHAVFAAAGFGALPVDADAAALAALAERVLAREAPAGLLAALAARFGDQPLAVRSSISLEDRVAGAAAGVFASRRAVAPAERWSAVRAVWASVFTPLVVAYARGGGADLEVGVVLQRHVEGAPITVYTRGPDDDRLRVQRDGAIELVARDRALAPAAAAVRDAALAAEAVVGAPTGADVELIAPAEAPPWIVQARPIVAPAVVPPRRAPPPSLLAPLRESGLRWRWDVEHNPAPLSPAQASLVARVSAAGLGGWRLATVAGYLYMSPRPEAPAPPSPPRDPVALRAALDDALARCHQALDAAPTATSPREALAATLERYLAGYQIWAEELAPAIAAARAALAADLADAGHPPSTLAARLAHRPRSIAGLLSAVAAGALPVDEARRQLADHAPSWDVACPTYGERPAVLAAALARARPAPPPAPPAVEPAFAARAQAIADAAELDDRWFARAQAEVRRALLAVGAATGLGDDACWVPTEALLTDAAPPLPAWRAAARAARAADARARAWRMPVEIGGPATPPEVRPAWVGTGGAGRALGRVHRLGDDAELALVPAGAVVVTAALTPAMAVLVGDAAALVSATGGPLDHGAAMARELGVPFVCGCPEAWAELADGELVAIDDGAVRRA